MPSHNHGIAPYSGTHAEQYNNIKTGAQNGGSMKTGSADYKPVIVIAQLHSANTITINSAHMVGNVLNVTARSLKDGSSYVGNSAGPINCIVSCEII